MSDDVVFYQVRYRLIGATDWINYGDPTTDLQSVLSTLEPDINYEVQVVATNREGSTTSDPVPFVTRRRPPASPGVPIANNVTSTTAVLTWMRSPLGSIPINYQLQYRVHNIGAFQNIGTLITGTTLTIVNLTPGTSYDFQVVASNSAGTATSPFTTVTTTVAGAAPSAVANLRVTSQSTTTIGLAWNAATGMAPLTYQVRRRVHGIGSYVAVGGPISGTALTVTGLTLNTSYDFVVDAINPVGTTTSAVLTAATTSGVVVGAPTSTLHGIGRMSTIATAILKATSSIRGTGSSLANSTVLSSTPVTPTTWNPADKAAITLTGGNLIATSDPTLTAGVRSTTAKSAAGKSYMEIKCDTVYPNEAIGFANSNWAFSGATPGVTGNSIGLNVNGNIVYNNIKLGSLASGIIPQGATVGMALDFGAGMVYFTTDGVTWNGGGSANPATGVGGYSIANMISGGRSAFAVYGTPRTNIGTLITGSQNSGPTNIFPYMTGPTNIRTVPAGTDTGGGTTGGGTTTSGTTRNWYDNPGGDGSYVVLPFQTTATWIRSGAAVTSLRSGGPRVRLQGDYITPTYVGTANDPLCTITDAGAGGTTRTFQMHVPAGAVAEQPPAQDLGDSAIGLMDITQPYMYVAMNGVTIDGDINGAVQPGGSTIAAATGMLVGDATGPIDCPAINGTDGTVANFNWQSSDNAYGVIVEAELQKAAADPNYVIQHMLAASVDAFTNGQADLSTPAAWPGVGIDLSGPVSGPIRQWVTVGIPADIAMPGGLSRGGQLLWHVLQQFGAMINNVNGSGSFNLQANPQSGATINLVNQMNGDMGTIAASLCILNPNTGVAGGQYSAATAKGMINSTRSDAFPAPPPLDLTPTGGVPVPPGNFGAWYSTNLNITYSTIWEQASAPPPPPPPSSSFNVNGLSITDPAPSGACQLTVTATIGTITLGSGSGGAAQFAGSQTVGTAGVDDIVITGPATASIPTGGNITIGGNVSLSNALQTGDHTASSCTMNLVANLGTWSVTPGSGTFTQPNNTGWVQYNADWADLMAVLASAVYNAPASAGSDLLAASFFDAASQQEIDIQATISTGGAQTGASVTLNDTFANLNTALAALVYNAPTNTGNGSLNFALTEGTKSASMVIPVQVAAFGLPAIKTANFGATPFVLPSPAGYNSWNGTAISQLPAAPTNVAATNITINSMLIGWTGSATGTTPITYQPQFRLRGQTTWTNFGNPISGTSVNLTGLQTQSTYQVQVVAINSAGSTPSAIITAGTVGAGVPGDATGVTASRIADLIRKFGFNVYPMIGGTNVFGASGAYTIAGVEATYRWLLGSSGHTFTSRGWYDAGQLSLYQQWSTAQFFRDVGGNWALTLVNGADASNVNYGPLIQDSSTTNGWLKWLEGCNEPNFNSMTPAQVIAAQQAIKALTGPTSTALFPCFSVSAPVAISGIPPDSVYEGFYGASLPQMVAAIDIASTHNYPPFNPDFNDTSNRGSWTNDIAQGSDNAYSSKPKIITEFHPTLYNNQTPSHSLDPNYDCYYLPINGLSLWRAGFQAWMWWPLYDGYGFTCGMFVTDSTTPRPAAYVLQAMCQLCPDSGSNALTFAPGKLDISFTGLPAPVAGSPNSGGQFEVFQGSDGKFYVFVWNSQQDPGGAAATVTVHFNSHTMANVKEYIISRNINNGTSPMAVVSNQSLINTMTLSLPAEVHLLVITY
jgi:hypothetical protein